MKKLVAGLCLGGSLLAVTAGSCSTTVTVDAASGSGSGTGTGGSASSTVTTGAGNAGGGSNQGGAGPGGAGGGACGGSNQGGSGPGSGGATQCNLGVCPSPGSVSGFQPTWKPPTGAHQNVCTEALIDAYYNDCINATGPACPFGPTGDPEMQACAQCLASQYSDSTWGPLVFSPGIVETNTAGCIALLEPSAIACAMSVEAEDECEHTACDPVCGVQDDPTFDGWVTCSAAANGCGCESWFVAAQCVTALSNAQSPAASCLIGQTFQDYYYATAAVFCGP